MEWRAGPCPSQVARIEPPYFSVRIRRRVRPCAAVFWHRAAGQLLPPCYLRGVADYLWRGSTPGPPGESQSTSLKNKPKKGNRNEHATPAWGLARVFTRNPHPPKGH